MYGTPESILLKWTVTVAPAGTVIVLLSNARFWAVRSTEAAPPAAVVAVMAVVGGTVVGAVVVIGMTVAVASPAAPAGRRLHCRCDDGCGRALVGSLAPGDERPAQQQARHHEPRYIHSHARRDGLQV